MVRNTRWSVGIALVLCVALAGTALAAITWGAQKPIPGTYAWNYSNSMDFTGTPGTTNFKLHDAFVSDAKTCPGLWEGEVCWMKAWPHFAP